MAQTEEREEKAMRIQRIRDIVTDDFDRISQAESPYRVLNASEHEMLAELEERYERYERFYRAENFQRLGDMELTRKALEIRRAIGRSIIDIRQSLQAPRIDEQRHDMGLFALEEDSLSMAEIFFRDGMTYLQLGDMSEASRVLLRAIKYNPNKGVALAYCGYVLFKLKSYDERAVADARALLDRAAEASEDDIDVFVLRGRFFARLKERDALQETILHIESINPTHPMIDKLQRKYHDMS